MRRPWFSATLATGAIALILAETPNQFPGLQIIGKAFFILDIVLFVTFTILITTRFILFPWKLVASIHHPDEGLFFGGYLVSIDLILESVQNYVVPSSGPWLIKTMEVAFWVYSAVALLVAIGQYYAFFQSERFNVCKAMPCWIFPIYPILVIGPLAGTILPSQPQSAAFPMWVGAVMFLGLAWTVALMMYSIYMQRLMTSPLPPPSARPGMYVSVGPAGYTAAGLVSLGLAGPRLWSGNDTGYLPPMNSEIITAFGTLGGTFVILFAFWFFSVSTIAVVNGFLFPRSEPVHFTLNWWAFVFPNAGLTIAAIQIGKVYKSPGINGVCSALTILLVILWVVIAIAHVRAVFRREIMWPGKDDDSDMKRMDWGRYTA